MRNAEFNMIDINRALVQEPSKFLKDFPNENAFFREYGFMLKDFQSFEQTQVVDAVNYAYNAWVLTSSTTTTSPTPEDVASVSFAGFNVSGLPMYNTTTNTSTTTSSYTNTTVIFDPYAATTTTTTTTMSTLDAYKHMWANQKIICPIMYHSNAVQKGNNEPTMSTVNDLLPGM